MRAVSMLKILVTLLLMAAGVHPLAADAQDMHPTSAALAVKIAASGRKTVAVADFTDLQGNGTELGRFLAEELSVALVGDAKGFEVIDRSSIRVILQEHKLASQGLIDPATARKLGQIAGVETLVTGTITPLGDSVHVALKVLDTESAKMVAGFTIEVPRTKAVDELLSKGIASTNQPSLTPSPQVTVPQGQSSPSFQLGDFAFSFIGCRKGIGDGLSDQIVCWGYITNKSAQREDLTIGDHTYLVDNLGHQSGISYASIAGDGGAPCCSAKGFEPDLPLQFWFDSRGFSDEVTSVTILFIANGHRITLRNIRLQGK